MDPFPENSSPGWYFVLFNRSRQLSRFKQTAAFQSVLDTPPRDCHASRSCCA